MSDGTVFREYNGGETLYYRLGDLLKEWPSYREVAVISGNQVFLGNANNGYPVAELDGDVVIQSNTRERLFRIIGNTLFDISGTKQLMYSKDHMSLTAAGILMWKNGDIRGGDKPLIGDYMGVDHWYEKILNDDQRVYFRNGESTGEDDEYSTNDYDREDVSSSSEDNDIYSGRTEDHHSKSLLSGVVIDDPYYWGEEDEPSSYADMKFMQMIEEIYDDDDDSFSAGIKVPEIIDTSCRDIIAPTLIMSVVPLLFCIFDSILFRAWIAIFGIPVMLICLFNIFVATSVRFNSGMTIRRKSRSIRGATTLVLLAVSVSLLLFAVFSGVTVCAIIHFVISIWILSRSIREISLPDIQTV
jgi:hypothetical protein